MASGALTAQCTHGRPAMAMSDKYKRLRAAMELECIRAENMQGADDHPVVRVEDIRAVLATMDQGESGEHSNQSVKPGLE